MPSLLHHYTRQTVRSVAVLAVFATLAAVLTACKGTADFSGRTTRAALTRISGAGSTFDAPFFSTAFAAYQKSHPGVGVSYAAVGSSAGIARFAAGQTDFGATDVPASPADLAGSRGGPALQVPVDLGAVSVAYNVLHLSGRPLRLTGPVLARIFLGQITNWDDPAITALNPGAGLPHTYINLVHRSDGSGTTYIFSDYLSHVSPAWAARVGTGRSLHWPVGYAADGNPGVTAAIDHTQDSIGYVERSYTAGTSVGTAAVQNQAGNYVTPTPAAIAADAASRPDITPASFSIVNQPGPAAYPICGYSWALISARQSDTSTGRALVTLLGWLTHQGQPAAAGLGYVPLPLAIQKRAAATLARVTGPGGNSLSEP